MGTSTGKHKHHWFFHSEWRYSRSTCLGCVDCRVLLEPTATSIYCTSCAYLFLFILGTTNVSRCSHSFHTTKWIQSHAGTKSGSCWNSQGRQPISTAIRGTHDGGGAALFAPDKPPPPSLFLQFRFISCAQPSKAHLHRNGQQGGLQACMSNWFMFLFLHPLFVRGEAIFVMLTGFLLVEQGVCYDAEGATAIYLGSAWREEHIDMYVHFTPFLLDALLRYSSRNGYWTNTSFLVFRGLHHRTLEFLLYQAISCQVIQRGPPDSTYAGGEYHGQLIFPSEYPFKPPGIKVRLANNLTPKMFPIVTSW